MLCLQRKGEIMAHVFRSGVINGPAAEVWKLVGAFDRIAEWNPAIATCRAETREGVERRHLTFEDGAELLECNMGADGMSTGYRILETAIPLEGYVGSISVVDQGDRCVLCWSSSFSSDEPGMADGVGQIYQAGIDTVAARFA